MPQLALLLEHIACWEPMAFQLEHSDFEELALERSAWQELALLHLACWEPVAFQLEHSDLEELALPEHLA